MLKINFISKLIVSLTLISFCLSYNIMVGSYIKDSFNSNDARLNKAFSIVNKEITSKNGGALSSISVVPVAIYHQIVNGVNYKIIAAIKDKKNLKVELTQSIVYTGPISDNFGSQTPSITFFEKLPNDNFTLEETTVIGLSASITEDLKKTNSSLVKVNRIASYPNLVYDESFYVVNAETTFGGVSSEKYFILSQVTGKAFIPITQIDFAQ
jgi:hypothetical protein